jgi:hypothetical protein
MSETNVQLGTVYILHYVLNTNKILEFKEPVQVRIIQSV